MKDSDDSWVQFDYLLKRVEELYQMTWKGPLPLFTEEFTKLESRITELEKKIDKVSVLFENSTTYENQLAKKIEELNLMVSRVPDALLEQDYKKDKIKLEEKIKQLEMKGVKSSETLDKMKLQKNFSELTNDLKVIKKKKNDLISHANTKTNLTTSEKSSDNAIPLLKKVGRNDPCPCGSGKKYKFCHEWQATEINYQNVGEKKNVQEKTKEFATEQIYYLELPDAKGRFDDLKKSDKIDHEKFYIMRIIKDNPKIAKFYPIDDDAQQIKIMMDYDIALKPVCELANANKHGSWIKVIMEGTLILRDHYWEIFDGGKCRIKIM